VTRHLDDLDVDGRVVIVRSDLNVPMSGPVEGLASIFDERRIVASVPTIDTLRKRGARVVVLSHLGRPKGVRVPELSLEPVATRLGELLGAPVSFTDEVSGPAVQRAVDAAQPGSIIMLQNTRFDRRETSKDAADRQSLAGEWATWADAFVSDGFGVVHREQASVTDIARLLPNAAGLLVDQEIASFSRVLTDPERPFVVVMGGSKVSDKVAVLGHLLDRVDRILIGGAMAFTFLRAEGLQVGDSLLEEDMIPVAEQILADARVRGVETVLPLDVVIAREISAEARTEVVEPSAIPVGWKGLDIGPATVAAFADDLAHARTIVWNGPMGVFEVAPFAEGTRGVAAAIAGSAAFTVVGGGDSAAAIRKLGLDESAFNHISTGGGASLELLEGRTLPGLAVLEETP